MTTMDDTGFGPTDFRKYHHAIVLAMEGSFIRASDRLCITQSALTRSIQTLEKELGIPLFDRRRNRISMTPAGKQILERAQAVLSQAKNMARDVELIRGGKLGNVSLGATPIAGAILLPAVLAEAYARHPHLGVTIESNSSLELITKLLEEKIEFFIGYSSQFSNRTDISIQPLIRIPVDFFVRAGHPLLSVDDIDAKALSAYPLVSTHFSIDRRTSPSISRLYGPGTDNEHPARIICDEMYVQKALALGSDAVLLTARYVVQPELVEGKLHRLPVMLSGQGNSAFSPTLCIVKLADRVFSPTAAFLVKTMRQIVRQKGFSD